MSKLAILIVAFNRPELTLQVFNAVKAYQPNKLYVAVDGVRKHVIEDDENAKGLKPFFRTLIGTVRL
jgi:hypothetical protein